VSVVKVERRQSSCATAEALRSFSSGLALDVTKGSKTEEDDKSISTPQQLGLEDYLAAEAIYKFTSILYCKPTGRNVPKVLDEAIFTGNYTDDGVNHAGSANVKTRKHGVMKCFVKQICPKISSS
jgi:hypothetical protein